MASSESREDWILREAQKRPAAECSAFLDDACAGDLALRQCIEAQLAAQQESDTAVATAGEGHRPPIKVSLVDAPDEAVGLILGRYKVLQKIGEGGCGAVYMAEQEQPVRRRVALKVIKLGMDTKAVIARFEAERQALALMDHPNIAKVLDGGATEAGRPYFVMELVRGIKFTEYCDQTHLSVSQRLELFTQICQAIQHAHQKGIIHRDIKPSNILVTLHDGVPVPKVIDFGIAKATTDQRLTDKTLFTAYEQFMGTPAYMSPEQAEMSGLDVDTRTDIYSLGVLLYELLTGKTPFDPKELMESGLEAMRKTIREKDPVRPSTKLHTLSGEELTTTAKRHGVEGRRLVSQLRGDLDWIVMKCLEKDRTRRYETANGLAMDIKRHLNNEPVLARPPSKLYEFQKTFRRHKVGFVATAVVILVLVAGVALTTWQAMRATRAESEQSRLRQKAEASAEAARQAQLSEAEQRRTAEAQRKNAQSQELVARQQAYAADMNLVQQSLAIGNLGRARALLNRHKPQAGQPDLRGWEWRYLWGQSRSDAVTGFGPGNQILSSLAISPDGNWLAAGTWGHLLYVFNLRTKQLVTPGPTRMAGKYLGFSSHSPLLAFPVETEGESRVRLWDAAKKQVVKDLPLGGRCGRLAFSADGNTLVTTTEELPDSKLTLWSIPAGEVVRSLPINPMPAGGEQLPLAVAPDLSVVAYVANDRPGVIQVIDIATGQKRWSAPSAEKHVVALAVSPDGKLLASGQGLGGRGSKIRLWDLATGKQIGRPLEGHRAWVSELVFWPDGKKLASASADQTIRLWDVTDPSNVSLIRTLQGHRDEVWSLALMPGARYLVSGSKDGELLVWDASADGADKGPIRFPAVPSTWRLAPDSKSVLTLDEPGRLVRWTGSAFQIRETLLEFGPNLNGGFISPDCRVVAIGSTNGLIQVWDVPGRALTFSVPVSTQNVVPIGLLQNTKTLFAYREDDSSIREWDLSKMTEIRSWLNVPAGRDYPRLVLTENTNSVLLAGGAGWGRLLNLSTGAEKSFGPSVYSDTATISPDGKFLADARESGVVELWNWEAGAIAGIHTFERFMLGAHSVAFSPDSKRLVAGSGGYESVRLWDVESKQELLMLDSPGSLFWDSAFSPDGNLLASKELIGGSLYLWRAPSWEEIEAAEAAEKTAARGQ